MGNNEELNKYKFCNHHHEIKDDEEIVDFGTGKFVADKEMIPLLKALNEVGLITRTHNFSKKENSHFISIVLDNVNIEIRDINEIHSTRDKFNGKKELLLTWK